MMTYRAILLLATALMGHVWTAHACGDQVLSQTFDKYSGTYKTWTKPMGKEDFPGFIFLKDDSFTAVGEQNLRASNPQGCVGTAQCGATFDVELPPMEEATLTYRYKHSPGYIYGKGGKLPGLCAMDCPSGCSTVTADSGFSARIMWREDDLMSYSYYAGMTEDHCGENWYWDQTTTAGEWHTIKMHVKLNTNGEANGQQTIEYDGKVVYAAKDILWAERPDLHPIQKLTVRSFHGGGSPSWASAQDQYIYFDDFDVSRGNCIGDAAPTGGVSAPQNDVNSTADNGTAVTAAVAQPKPESKPATTGTTTTTAIADSNEATGLKPDIPVEIGSGDGGSGGDSGGDSGAHDDSGGPDHSENHTADHSESGDGHGSGDVNGTFSEEDEDAFVQSSIPTPSECADNWKRCEGACCDESFHCVVKNINYVQCRPKDYSIPEGWEGTILS